MPRTSGITIERNAYGKPRFLRIDIAKYFAELEPFLKRNGIVLEDSPYNPEFVKKIKSQESMLSKIIKTEDLWK